MLLLDLGAMGCGREGEEKGGERQMRCERGEGREGGEGKGGGETDEV